MTHGMVSIYSTLCIYIILNVGTKNVAKTLTKVIKGRRGNPVKDQLSDKRLSVSHTHTSFSLALTLQVVAPRDIYTGVWRIAPVVLWNLETVSWTLVSITRYVKYVTLNCLLCLTFIYMCICQHDHFRTSILAVIKTHLVVTLPTDPVKFSSLIKLQFRCMRSHYRTPWYTAMQSTIVGWKIFTINFILYTHGWC